MCIRDRAHTEPVDGDAAQDLDVAVGDPAGRQREDLDLMTCLLYTSDAADERSSVDLGGRRIIKKKNILLYV